MTTFHNFLLKIEAGEAPPPAAPPGGAAGAPPPPGGDPMAGGGDPMAGLGGAPGGDPMAGGAGGAPGSQAPRKGINITTAWDAIKSVLGHSAERKEKPHQPKAPKNTQPQEKKPKSLMQ